MSELDLYEELKSNVKKFKETKDISLAIDSMEILSKLLEEDKKDEEI